MSSPLIPRPYQSSAIPTSSPLSGPVTTPSSAPVGAADATVAPGKTYSFTASKSEDLTEQLADVGRKISAIEREIHQLRTEASQQSPRPPLSVWHLLQRGLNPKVHSTATQTLNASQSQHAADRLLVLENQRTELQARQTELARAMQQAAWEDQTAVVSSSSDRRVDPTMTATAAAAAAAPTQPTLLATAISSPLLSPERPRAFAVANVVGRLGPDEKLTLTRQELTPVGNKESQYEQKNALKHVLQACSDELTKGNVDDVEYTLNKLLANPSSSTFIENSKSLRKRLIKLQSSITEKRTKHVRRELGLTSKEAKDLSKFIEQHEKEWELSTFTGQRYPRSTYPLPRTLEVFKDTDGSVKIMVLGKTKGGVPLIGKGSSKSAKKAIEWKSGQPYADVVVHDGLDEFMKEVAMTNAIAGRPGLASPFLRARMYTGKGGKAKAGAFQPLYPERLDAVLQKGNLTPLQRKILARDILTGIAGLKALGIEHGDLKLDNIYISLDREGNPRAHIADFGLSRFTGGVIPDRELYGGGNRFHTGPERRFFPLIPSTKQIHQAAAKAIYLPTIDSGDNWGIGLVLMAVLDPTHIQVNGLDRAHSQAFDIANVLNAELNKLVDQEYDKKGVLHDLINGKPEDLSTHAQRFYSSLQLSIEPQVLAFQRGLPPELQAEGKIVAGLLVADPAQRLTADQALRQLLS